MTKPLPTMARLGVNTGINVSTSTIDGILFDLKVDVGREAS